MANSRENGYYSNSTGKHFQFGDLDIYKSQYNIGREIVEMARTTAVLNLTDDQQADGKRKFQNINLLFLGPPHITLRKQTKGDLKIFLKEKIQLPGSYAEDIGETRVLNSSSIQGNYEGMSFIQTLRLEPHDTLHLVVLDEAHYGMAHASVIDKFLRHLTNVREEIISATRSPPTLLVLMVSATFEVLSRVVESYKDSSQRINWSKLRSDDRRRFGAPIYRDIFNLRLYNDTNPAILNEEKLVDRSTIVAMEYIQTIEGCMMTIFNQKTSKGWKSNATWEALQFLFPGSTDAEIAARVGAEDYPTSGNCMVVLRLESNSEIIDLHRNISQLFERIGARTSGEVQPFEVITLISESESIRNQLSSKAIRHLKSYGKNVDQLHAVKDLEELPCLLLLNEKLGMGERLPSSCMAYDVRARYRGDARKMNGNAAKFVQDIGRCCGHGKPQAVILMSVTDSDDCAGGKEGQLAMKDITFRRLHGLLTTKDDPAKKHPEKHEKVYTKLLPCSIALDAEPQMGKTGAILSTLEILYFEHISPLDTPRRHPQQNSLLKKWTKQFCEIVNNPDESPENNIGQLKSTLADDDLFGKYHAMMDNFRQAKQLTDSIFKNSLLGAIHTAAKAKEPVFSVVDCGCGLHGIIYAFRSYSADLDLPVRVVGIDLHERIHRLCHLESVRNVTFTACVSDMASTSESVLQEAPYNVVLYCLSLFENEVTRHINWANKQLRNSGMLIIADINYRFSDKFEKSVEKLGFKHYASYGIADMFKVFSFKKVSDDIDESTTVQLKPY